MSELLERMKAALPPGWDDPKLVARRHEAIRRHDFLCQLQAIAAMKKIQYMTPGLYRYPGIPGGQPAEIFLITEDHRLFEAEASRDINDPPGVQECHPSGWWDLEMLWRFRRIA